MYHHLYKYLEKFKILYPLQSGFRENCSTMHALISITESIRQSIDNNEFVCGKFIDSKKPFNTVNLRILLTKLNHYRIRGNALEWFESYLSHRLQQMYLLMVITQFLSQLLVVFPKDPLLDPFYSYYM